MGTTLFALGHCVGNPNLNVTAHTHKKNVLSAVQLPSAFPVQARQILENDLSMSLQASVPKFDRIPWLCEASLRNKPLVLSLPKRYPHGSATSLNSWRKDVNLPNTFQVPNGLSKARRNQRGLMLDRNQQLCSTCQEVKMVQPRTMMIPNDLKHSFENCMSHRMKSLQPPKAQTEPRCSPDDISTESIHYRLPLLGPRAGAFHELLSDSYKALRGIQLSASPRKEPTGKTMRQ